METIKKSNVIRFGNFEVNLRTGELHKHGLKLKIQEQPFQVLAMLLERSGQLVTREEFRTRLWPKDTFVDFEHGLNAAVRRLREVLNDNAGQPRFVETLPRRGYRFIAPVQSAENLPSEQGTPTPGSTDEAKEIAGPQPEAEGINKDSVSSYRASGHSKRNLRFMWVVACAALVLLIIVGAVFRQKIRHQDGTARFLQRQLTANASEIPLWAAAISPDGKYLAYSDTLGLHLQLLKNGQTQAISVPEHLAISDVSWVPDGTELLVSGESGGNTSVWLVPVLGGSPLKLRDQAASPLTSPEGTMIAFLGDIDAAGKKHGIWVMDIAGESAHRVLAAQPGEQFFRVRWSPDGQRLAFAKSIAGVPAVAASQTAIGTEALGSVSLDGRNSTSILTKLGLQDFYWLPDGRILLSVAREDLFGSDSNLWAIHVDQSGRPQAQPEQLTNWAGFAFTDFSSMDNGRGLAFLKVTSQMDVYVGRLDLNRTPPLAPRRLTLNDRNDWPIEWMPDGAAVLFWSDRNGTWDIFKQRLDEETAEMIPTGSEPKWYAHFSPDGRNLLYMALHEQQEPGGTLPVRIMRVPSEGGPSQEVLTAVGTTNFSCARQPATLCVFNEVIGDDTVIMSFDPFKGRGREVFRAKSGEIGDFSLSPDGTRLAVTHLDPHEGRIRLVSLDTGAFSDLLVKGWNNLFELNWAPDGRGLYISSQTQEAGTVLYVDLKGNAHALWQQEGNLATCGRPSPDGHSLAVASKTTNANAWTLEQF